MKNFDKWHFCKCQIKGQDPFPLQRGLSESCIWTLRHAWQMKSSEPLKGVMSEAEACLRKNEFRGLALLKRRALWAAGTLVVLYKVVLVLRNKCPDSWPPCGAQRFGLSVFFISCGLGHRPCLKGQLFKLHPPLTWTLVPHPNKEAKKHMKCIRAGSRKRGQETMWLFYSITSLIHTPLRMHRHPIKVLSGLSPSLRNRLSF